MDSSMPCKLALSPETQNENEKGTTHLWDWEIPHSNQPSFFQTLRYQSIAHRGHFENAYREESKQGFMQ